MAPIIKLCALAILAILQSPGTCQAGKSEPGGVLIPLYSSNDKTWERLLAAKNKYKNVPMVVVWSGEPLNSENYNKSVEHYKKYIAAGFKFISYTHTRTKDWQSKRPLNEIEADIDKIALYYPNLVHGIFFDNCDSNLKFPDYRNRESDLVAYYKHITAYAHSKGFKMTVGNAAKNINETFANCFDTYLIYESGNGYPNQSVYGGWRGNYPKERWGIIPWAIPNLDREKIRDTKKFVKYIYPSSEPAGSPIKDSSDGWLPSYFEQLIEYLSED